jgi:hypothetical protein
VESQAAARLTLPAAVVVAPGAGRGKAHEPAVSQGLVVVFFQIEEGECAVDCWLVRLFHLPIQEREEGKGVIGKGGKGTNPGFGLTGVGFGSRYAWYGTDCVGLHLPMRMRWCTSGVFIFAVRQSRSGGWMAF